MSFYRATGLWKMYIYFNDIFYLPIFPSHNPYRKINKNIYIYMLDENQRENKDKYDKMSKMKI